MKSKKTISALYRIPNTLAIWTAVLTTLLLSVMTVPAVSEIAQQFSRPEGSPPPSYIFAAENPIASMLLYPALLICGAVTALLVFSFCFSRTHVNAVMSFPLRRHDVFLVRTAMGLTALFVTVFIPLTATLSANIALCGISAAVLKAYASLLFSMLLSELLGFAAALVALSFAGSAAEASALTGLILVLPNALIYFFGYACTFFLRGYSASIISIFWGGLFTRLLHPTLTAASFVPKYRFLTPVFAPACLNGETGLIEYYAKISSTAEPAALAGGNGAVIAVWSLIAVTGILLAGHFFKKKRFENAGLSAGSKKLNLVFASFLGFVAVTLFTRELPAIFGSTVRYGSSYRAIGLIAFTVFCAAVFAAIFFTMLRKSKKRRRALLFTLGFLFACVLLPVILLFGGFGAETRVPVPSEVKSVICTVPDTDSHTVLYHYNNEDVYFSSQRDIETICALHTELCENDGDYTANISIVYELKDGTFFSRRFASSRIEDYLKFTVLFSADGYADYVDRRLNGGSLYYSRTSTAGQELKDEWDRLYSADNTYIVGTANQNYTSVDFLSGFSCTLTDGTDKFTEEQTKELQKCLINDIKNSDSGDFTASVPIGLLLFKHSELTEPSLSAKNSVYLKNLWSVYPFMTETVNYLTRHDMLKYLQEPDDVYITKAEITSISFNFAYVDHLPCGLRFSEVLKERVTDNPAYQSEQAYYANMAYEFSNQRAFLAHADSSRDITASAVPLKEDEILCITDSEALEKLKPKLLNRAICLDGSCKYVLLTFSDGYTRSFIIKAEDVPN